MVMLVVVTGIIIPWGIPERRAAAASAWLFSVGLIATCWGGGRSLVAAPASAAAAAAAAVLAAAVAGFGLAEIRQPVVIK